MATGGLLVTGFEPFGGAAHNPSGAAARALQGQQIAGRAVHGLELPCVFGLAAQRLQQALDQTRPALVLCLGLAPSRQGFSIERVAVNLDDARIADNAGAQPLDQAVLPAGPAAYFARLPVKAMVAALHKAGAQAELSHSAGSFVCNHVFYALMHLLATRPAVAGGFMHVGADLDAGAIVEGTRVALSAALAAPADGADLRVAGGRID